MSPTIMTADLDSQNLKQIDVLRERDTGLETKTKRAEMALLGEEDTDLKAKADRAQQVHEDIVASMCKDPQARMETVQAGMRWANTRVGQIQTQLKQLTEVVKEIQRLNPGMEKLDDAGIQALSGADTPGGKMLSAAQKLNEQATEELGKLREEHWKNK